MNIKTLCFCLHLMVCRKNIKVIGNRNGEHFVGGFDVSDQHTNAVLHILLVSDSKQNARKKVDLTRLKLVVSVR